MKIRSLK